MKKLLVTIADKNYLNISRKLFASILANKTWIDDFMLITTNDVEDKDLKWFFDNNIIVKKYSYYFSSDKWYSSLPKGVLNPIVCSKIYLFNSEFKEWDKILYLDSDIIVRHPLTEIKKIKTFGAVRNVNNPFLHKLFAYPNNSNKKLFDDLKTEYNLFSHAFNAGVFCFDTSIIKQDLKLQFNELFHKYSKISIYSEQSILNLLLNKKWESLPNYFNYDVNRNMIHHKINPKRIVAKVIHFNGPIKPWNENSYFFNEWSGKKDSNKLINNSNHQMNSLVFTTNLIFFKIYCFIKKIMSLRVKFFVRHIIINYNPKLYMYLKKWLIPKN